MQKNNGRNVLKDASHQSALFVERLIRSSVNCLSLNPPVTPDVQPNLNALLHRQPRVPSLFITLARDRREVLPVDGVPRHYLEDSALSLTINETAYSSLSSSAVQPRELSAAAY